MCDISTFYNKPKYLPFLIYCREHHFITMDDLVRCPFHLLNKEPGFTSILASRVKAMYLVYLKTQKKDAAEQEKPQPESTDSLADNVQKPAAATASTAPAAAPVPKKAAPAKAAPSAPKVLKEPDIVKMLHAYFQENGDRLIKIDDACKAVGGRAKRSEITKILQNVAWCQIVDKGTFFYTPLK